MRVLADRHHAGLLYSLQLLFEDRLGMELYVPVGHEWWDEGYWRFGEVFGDDRLAQQYLQLEGHEWSWSGWEYVTEDVEFPGRLIRGIQLNDARKLQWDFTLASVQENQPGFAQFAQEVGAKSIYQVGNRGQRIDWELDPLVIASAEIPFTANARAVRYHQEYDKDGIFAYQEIPWGSSIVVKSFVNCFSSIHPQYALWQEALVRGPEFIFCEHGHDGFSGLVQPTTAVAQAMTRAGWAWHDKPQGDGFGHVIHYWASIGRPLIGHASYYRGLFAEHLWEDLVTCIDLDKHSVEEVVDLMNCTELWTQREMGRELRRRVDQLIDFDDEERQIRELLSLPA